MNLVKIIILVLFEGGTGKTSNSSKRLKSIGLPHAHFCAQLHKLLRHNTGRFNVFFVLMKIRRRKIWEEEQAALKAKQRSNNKRRGVTLGRSSVSVLAKYAATCVQHRGLNKCVCMC